jgi:KDO2-lipid IV(A) lauroyltransferase
MVSRMRSATGQKVILREGAIQGIRKVLREGGQTALLMDQNTLPSEGGEFVRFFDRQVPVSKAISILARRLRVQVVFAYAVAEDDGTCTIYMEFPDEDEARSTPGGWTQVVTSRLEKRIRERPGQWLWMYRRWKYYPSGESPERYPFYAKPAPE